MIDLRKIALTFFFFNICLCFLFSQDKFTHPRGLILKEEVPCLRTRIQQEPFKSMMSALKKSTEEMAVRMHENVSDSSEMARLYSYLYVLSGNTGYAGKAWDFACRVMNNPGIFNNPVSRGLNRARLLRNIAETYDFCFDAWSQEQRVFSSEKLIYVIMTTSSNMGYDANYSIESNWMGVRYGAIYFATLVCDDYRANDNFRSRLLPYEWDSNKRLKDHMAANINSNGWNTESLSYFSYNWSFVGPALVAFKNHFRNKFDQFYEPKSLNSLWGYSTASVAIQGINSKVMQPDFSDDDPMSDYYLIPLGLRLFPDSQKPSLLWMLNYLSGPDTWANEAEQLFYNIAWYPENVLPENPEKAGWLTYCDADQGVALFRNRFQDNNDILAAFTATAKRVRGHQGEDNLGFRLIGLGSIWAVGAGRTGLIAGQSTLFPYENISDTMTGDNSLGKVIETEFKKDGSGFIKASGSCMGVVNHRRTFIVDYGKKSGAEAVFIVSDISDNGKTWRMNSPEFNTLKILKDGFLLTSPNGAELKAVVFSDADSLTVSSRKVHYGGNTLQQNNGVAFNGKNYSWTNAIDCNTKGKITVVLTLQPKGSLHPQVSLTKDSQIVIGNKIYTEIIE
jgi:hypothetical protein